MQQADTGSVVVTDDGKVVGILTERDLLRAAAGQRRSRPGAGPALDDGPPRRARSRRAGRRRLGQPDLAPLPAPAGRRRRPLRRRGVAARPHGGGPHPARRRGRAATSRPGSRAWSWPRRRSATCAARRASSTTGSTRRSSWPRSDRSRTSGTCSSRASSPTRRPRPPSATRCGGGAPCRRACTPCCPPSAQRGAPLDVLRTAVSLLGAGARLAPDPRHRGRRAVRPGPRALRGRADDPGRRPTGCARGRSRSSRGTTSASPPTTSTC